MVTLKQLKKWIFEEDEADDNWFTGCKKQVCKATGIPAEEGYYFFIDGGGSVCKIRISDYENGETNYQIIYKSIINKGEDYFYFLDKNGNICQQKKPASYLNEDFIKNIINLLKERNEKMASSDIDAHLKYQDVDEVKQTCEILYHKGLINRTGNYRYFILNEDKKTHEKSVVDNTEEVDIKKELKKYKELLDEGLIEKEDFDAKKKELLGL
tara:strand:+ start:258 stop:893 length:636 start_codon:yes stop_codon:yes gene_type:complete